MITARASATLVGMENLPGLKLVAIVRVSTKEQATEQRAGIARQTESIRRIASGLGATVERLITISDVSGSDVADTKEWTEQIVPQLRNGAHLAVDAIDRIIRPDGFDFRVLAVAKKLGANIFTPGGKVDLTKPEGFLLGGMSALFGGMEKMAIKRRIHESKEAKRRRGEFTQADICLPLGINYDRKARRWGYAADKWKPADAFRMLVVEGVQPVAIAKHIGVTLAGLKVILRNSIYRGIASYEQRRTGEAYASAIPGHQAEKRKVKRAPDEIIRVRVFGGEGQSPALVDDVTWERAQVLLRERQENRQRIRAKSQPRTYYSGFIVTPGGNEHVMYGKTANARRDYYVCRCRDTSNPSAPTPGCGFRSLPLDEINQALDKQFHSSPSFWLPKIHLFLKTNEKQEKEDVNDLKKQKQAISTQLERLVDLLLADRVDRGVYDRKYEKLQAAGNVLQQKIDRATIPASESEFDLEALEKYLREVMFYPEWSHEKKRAWLSQYIAAIHVDNKGVSRIDFRLPHSTVPIVASNWTWKRMLGHDPFDQALRQNTQLKKAGLSSASQVAEQLKISTGTLRYYILSGQLPEPKTRKGLKRYWDAEDYSALVDAKKRLDTKRAQP